MLNMNKKILILALVVAIGLAAPFGALAQQYGPDDTIPDTSSSCPGQSPNLCTIINLVIYYLNQILLLFMAFAIVMFVWYIIKYFIKADADKKEAGNYAMYSVIGFFIILSVWGIVNIIGNTFGLGNASNSGPSVDNINSLFPR